MRNNGIITISKKIKDMNCPLKFVMIFTTMFELEIKLIHAKRSNSLFTGS